MSSAAPSVAFPHVDAKKHRVEDFDKLNRKMSWKLHNSSLRFVIMMNKMTKESGPLSNVAD